ncbi:hypothetical protein [Flavobacterium caeni]|uniref:Uncharacterized protein n=1 Tax=Flavobacterium caeni TaxID=490189 RepID=A0A1G5H8W5_9FLAO|nr:hypothetical protein [Flavobacterium caeni]SCY59398.1 hypothetical protein SAMN02927903_01789 [Flavobacterium caeni]
MKIVVSVLFLLFLRSADLSEVRKLYTDAAKSEANANAFANKLADVPDGDANKVLVAYKGCSLTLKSKFSGVLADKISFMKQGAKLIDAAAAAEPENIEIRMIRLSVQESVPRIVNYREHKKKDKALILKNYEEAGDLKEYIRKFIQQSKSFTAAEKKALN